MPIWACHIRLESSQTQLSNECVSFKKREGYKRIFVFMPWVPLHKTKNAHIICSWIHSGVLLNSRSTMVPKCDEKQLSSDGLKVQLPLVVSS